MFYCTLNDSYINEGTQFTIDGITYPAQWLNQSTPEQKAELGLEEVVATNQPYNPVYYWTGETLSGATLTYTGTPKDLVEVQNNAVAQVRQSAYNLLLPTDWMVVKAFETSTPINPDWNTWRASVRITAQDTITAIQSATDVDGVANVMSNINWPLQPGA